MTLGLNVGGRRKSLFEGSHRAGWCDIGPKCRRPAEKLYPRACTAATARAAKWVLRGAAVALAAATLALALLGLEVRPVPRRPRTAGRRARVEGRAPALDRLAVRLHGADVTVWVPRRGCTTNAAVFGVLSGHAGAREEIRATWGFGRCVFFVVGRPAGGAGEVPAALWAEAAAHEDVIVVEAADTYGALTLKTSAWFAFVHACRPRAQYAVKVDDDSFVRVNEFLRELYESGADYFGFGVSRSAVIREPGHRHFQDWSYNRSHYPPYALGAGYALSRRATACYVARARESAALASEDANTGVLMAACGVELFHTFSVLLERSELFVLLQEVVIFTNQPGRQYTVAHHVERGAGFRAEEARYANGAHVRVALTGRLGNHLFNLASGVGIARANRAAACYEGDFVGGGLFEVRVPRCAGGNATLAHFREAGFGVFEMPAVGASTCLSPAPLFGNGCACGLLTWPCNYFQSHKYFAHVDVRSVFRLRSHWEAYGEAYVRSRCADCWSVGIHVRRQDHVVANYLGMPGAEYFAQAMALFAGLPRVVFYVATDDAAWVAAQPVFARDDVWVLGAGRDEEFATLVACDHMIMSIGTFGWWAAFLGSHTRGGRVVYYRGELTGQEQAGNARRDDYYPAAWTAVGV